MRRNQNDYKEEVENAQYLIKKLKKEKKERLEKLKKNEEEIAMQQQNEIRELMLKKQQEEIKKN